MNGISASLAPDFRDKEESNICVNCVHGRSLPVYASSSVYGMQGNRKQEIFIRPKDNKTEYSAQKPYNILHLSRYEITK